MDKRPVIAVTLGDPAGVGPEVVVKAYLQVREHRVVAYGSKEALLRAAGESGVALDLRVVASARDAEFREGVLDVVDIDTRIAAIEPGVVSAEAGRSAAESLLTAARACAAGEVDALATAPTNKLALRAAGVDAEGQTQILGELWGLRRYGMLAVGGDLRVLLLTRHMSLRKALDSITTESTLEHLFMLEETLKRVGIDEPRIALAGFNPHAGEGGLFGTEDDTILTPAVRAARSRGVKVDGPLPADSVFGRAVRGEFDGVLALYHDQGLIAVKTVAANTAVTVLAGSPHLRVSVIHGAGFDRAGKNRADPSNMATAIRRAAEWAPLWKSKPSA